MEESPLPVELVVPGAEGRWIARTLRAAGLEVQERELPSEAPASLRVVERSVPGALDALLRFRGDDGARLVLLGWEPTSPDELEAVRADVFYPRPVPLTRLTRWARAVFRGEGVATSQGDLETPEEPLTLPEGPPSIPGPMTLPVPPPGDVPTPPSPSSEAFEALRPSGVPPAGADTELRDRDPLLDTHDEELPGALPPRDPTLVLEDDTEAQADGPPLAGSEGEASGPDATTGAAHALSPRIERLLREVDRRLFPDAAPLDLRFATGSEGPEELVPDELLDASELVGLREPTPGPESADGLTFVGPPSAAPEDAAPATPPVAARVTRLPRAVPAPVPEPSGPAPSPVASTVPPAGADVRPIAPRGTGVASWSGEGPAGAGGPRRGTLAPPGLFGLLWELHGDAGTRAVRFAPKDGAPLELSFAGGRLVAFEGPVAQEAASALAAAGRLAASPADDAAAEALLERALADGDLTPYARDRASREAAEALVTALVTSGEVAYAPVADEPTARARARARWLGGRLQEVAAEGARRRVDRGAARRVLAFDDEAALVLDASFRERAEEAGLEAELVRAFERHAGKGVGALLDGLPPEVGGPGALLVLAGVGALRFGALVGKARSFSGEAARHRLEGLLERVASADYFAVLELERDASAREVEANYARISGGILQLDLGALGLEGREAERSEALEVLDEARQVLRDARLRALYAAALARRDAGG